MKGTFEIEVDGVKRGFKFGTYAIAVACEKDGSDDINELFTRCGFIGDGNRSLKSLLNFFYGAAVNYAEHNGYEVDFNVANVSDWIDEIGMDKMNDLAAGGITAHEAKNSQPPANPGETTDSQSTTA